MKKLIDHSIPKSEMHLPDAPVLLHTTRQACHPVTDLQPPHPTNSPLSSWTKAAKTGQKRPKRPFHLDTAPSRYYHCIQHQRNNQQFVNAINNINHDSIQPSNTEISHPARTAVSIRVIAHQQNGQNGQYGQNGHLVWHHPNPYPNFITHLQTGPTPECFDLKK
ncbi:MAG: hypothetical protein J7527_13640 [Chitinophagaceae bacterium]|nr:hypothetical protein [Chitinophagaceae bacterium]